MFLMRTPLISVAMATYNGSRFLKEQLDSLLSQTYPNIEIIVVDDCSTDNTVEILKEYELKYNNIHICENEINLGVNQTFGKALKLTKGELIAICD